MQGRTKPSGIERIGVNKPHKLAVSPKSSSLSTLPTRKVTSAKVSPTMKKSNGNANKSPVQEKANTMIIEENCNIPEEIIGGSSLEIRHQELANVPSKYFINSSISKLDISFNSFINLEDLRYFPKLQSLRAMYNVLTSLKGVENCLQLGDANFQGNRLKDLDYLSKCSKLNSLCLDSNQLSICPNLSSLQLLSYITLDCNELKNVDGLLSLKNIAVISLSQNKISTLSIFNECEFFQNLIELDLSYNKLNNNGFNILDKFVKLLTLRLKGCGLSDISKFSTNKSIREINISDNELETLEGIADKLPMLEVMDVKNNKLPHVKSFISDTKGLEHLEILFLSGNPLGDITPNYEKILSTHMENLRFVDDLEIERPNEMSVDLTNTPFFDDEALEPLEFPFSTEEKLKEIISKQTIAAEEALEVKNLYENMMKNSEKLQTKFEESLIILKSNFNQFKDMIHQQDFNFQEEIEEETPGVYDPQLPPFEFPSTTLEPKELRGSQIFAEAKAIAEIEEELKAISGGRIRAAMKFSKQNYEENKDNEVQEEHSEISTEDTSPIINIKTAEKKKPPSENSNRSSLIVKRPSSSKSE
ncbi:hypothetical protein ABK040_001782 [Willaertia magna]